MKQYIYILFIFLFSSCHNKQDKDIGSMRVLYYNTIFETSVAIDCNKIKYSPPTNDTLDYETLLIDYSGVLDTIITNGGVLQKIATALNQREIIAENYMDARMKCYFNFRNGKVDSLCISDNPIYGRYNNELVKLPNEFIYLVRNNCGFYKWMGMEQMLYFEELNDSSFIREKVTTRSGEKY